MAKIQCPTITVTDSTGTSQFSGSGEIRLTEHGRLTIWIDLLAGVSTWELPVGPYELTGTTDDGRNLLADNAYLSYDGAKSGAAFAELVPRRCTLRAPGAMTSWSRRVHHLKNSTSLGLQRWSEAGVDYELVHRPTTGSLPSRDRAGLVDSTLEAKASTPRSDDFIDEKQRALHLLSLACRSPVASPMIEVFDGSNLVETKLVPNEWDHLPSHPLIPVVEIGRFMQIATPKHRAWGPMLDLDVLIEYYCRSHTESTAEFKFLFAGVVMESLKFHWALNVRNLPTKKSANGVIKEFLNPTGSAYSFKDLIDMVAADLAVKHTYTFIENRNTVFHTGKSAAAQLGAPSPYAILKPELVQLHDQIDDLFLTLLDYSGPIASWWAADNTVTFPGRT